VRTANPYRPVREVQVEHPNWSRDATLYQINQRQFTPEGNFRAAEAHLRDCETSAWTSSG